MCHSRILFHLSVIGLAVIVNWLNFLILFILRIVCLFRVFRMSANTPPLTPTTPAPATATTAATTIATATTTAEMSPWIIIENGSACIKAGRANDYDEEDIIATNTAANNEQNERYGWWPSVVFPNIIGEPLYRNPHFVRMGQKWCYVGDEATSKAGVLRHKYPIQHGMIYCCWH
jgi:hypothetical protein